MKVFYGFGGFGVCPVPGSKDIVLKVFYGFGGFGVCPVPGSKDIVLGFSGFLGFGHGQARRHACPIHWS